MADPLVVLAILATFLLAGMVKGVIGLGLPTVSLGLLTAVLDLPTAMVLLLVPSFATNVWQAAVGGNAAQIARRIWPFLLAATVTVWFGGFWMRDFQLPLLSALLGGLLLAYGGVSLLGARMPIRPAQEVWAGPVIGAVNGILTGLTGSFVVPGVMYLQGLGLPRDMLVQAMGMLFTVSTVALAISLKGNNFLEFKLGAMSMLALLPAIAGMWIGQHVRTYLSEQLFRRVFFASLCVLGAYILANSLARLA